MQGSTALNYHINRTPKDTAMATASLQNKTDRLPEPCLFITIIWMRIKYKKYPKKGTKVIDIIKRCFIAILSIIQEDNKTDKKISWRGAYQAWYPWKFYNHERKFTLLIERRDQKAKGFGKSSRRFEWENRGSIKYDQINARKSI